MELNREKLKRMFDDTKGNGGSANGGGGGGSLAGYATQAWVNEGFVSIDFFNRLFTVYGPGETSSDPDVVIEPNDLDSTITNIKAMFGLWTEQYLSALGLNPGGTGSATSLGMLDDVLLTNPAANQFLMYDGTSAKWINSAIKTINGQSLYGSGDISVGGGASGNYLPLTGGTLTGKLTINTSSYADQLIIKRNSAYDPTIVFTNSNNINRVLGTEAAKSLVESFYISDTSGNTKYYLLTTGNTKTRQIVIGSNRYDVYSAYTTDIVIPDTKVQQVLSDSSNTAYRPIIVGATNSMNPSDFATTTDNVLAVRTVYIQPESGKIFSCDIIPKTDLSYNIGSSSSMYIKGYFRYIDTINSYDLRLCASGVEGIRLRAGQTVNVGIGYDVPEYRLAVNGTIYASGAITALSDIREKYLEEVYYLPIEKIADAPSFKYTWVDKKTHDELLHVGSSAQYWQRVLPEVVLEAKDEKGTLSMQYGVAALVSAITIARKVVDHEQRIKQLEKENEKLKKQLKRSIRYGI